MLEALRRGDEAVFADLVERYYATMVRVAMIYLRDRSLAEDVVQETWLGVLRGLERFEGRSSLKTWIFRILTNRAKTRAVKEGRSLPFSALAAEDLAPSDPAVDPDRFFGGDAGEPGAWQAPPRSWGEIPEERLLAEETLAEIGAAIDELPPAQREVIRLRDVQGWSPAEVSEALDISDGNQRVLLHRARSKVRRALERYLEEE